MNVTIWNENVHERTEEHVRAIYPDDNVRSLAMCHAAVESAALGAPVSVAA